jgi:hypothetical protein
MESQLCPVCGAELLPEASFCGKCGASVTPTSDPEMSAGSWSGQLSQTLVSQAQGAAASLSDYRQKHPTAVNLSLAVASVVAFLLIGSYGLDLSGFALFLLFPLLVGATIPVFKLDLAISVTDRFGAWVVMNREKVAHRTGTFHKYGYKPYLGGLTSIKGWTEGINDRYLQSGVRLTSYLYFSLITVYLFLMALYLAVGIVIAIVVIIFALWVLGQALGGQSTGRSYSPPLAGFKRSKIVKEGFFSDKEIYHVDDQGRIKKPGFIFDEPTGYRVDEKGSLYKEGFFFDEKIHEVREDGTIVDVTGFFPKDTGYRVDENGKITKKGFFFDEDTQIRVKRND